MGGFWYLIIIWNKQSAEILFKESWDLSDTFCIFLSFFFCCCCCSVNKSCPTLRAHELQHARLSCTLLSPRIYSNSCPLSQWYRPTISFSITPFSSCLQSLPVSLSWHFSSGGQSIEASASASVLSMNSQGRFPLGLTGLISLLSKGLSRVFSSTIFFLLLFILYWKVKVKSLSRVWVFATPRTVAYQVPPSMGFSRQEYWSGLPLPSPGDVPNSGIEPTSPAL